MLDSEQITSILKGLDGEESEFISIIDTIMKTLLRFQQNSAELREECLRLFNSYDTVFQITIINMDFSCFIKISEGEIAFGNGIFQEQELSIPVVSIEIPKDILLQVVKQEFSVERAYNKGIIKIKGNLSNLMRLRVLLSYYLKYINKVFRTKGSS
jgi:hypothetical protein